MWSTTKIGFVSYVLTALVFAGYLLVSWPLNQIDEFLSIFAAFSPLNIPAMLTGNDALINLSFRLNQGLVFLFFAAVYWIPVVCLLIIARFIYVRFSHAPR